MGRMGEFVARLQWEGMDLTSMQIEGGLALVRLDEVLIEKREVTKGEKMLTRRMVEMGKDRPTVDDVRQLQEEIGRDPSAGEIAETWFLKSVQLSRNYFLGYAEHPGDGVVGFGFSSGLGEVPREQGCGMTFSWDWF